MSRRIAAKITGVSGYVPPRVMSNADLEKLVDTSDEWIRERTGIRERHVVEPGIGSSDLATAAARTLLESRGVSAEDIDLIVVASVTPDMMFPATACLVQDKLGATNAWGFDLSAACSGFIYAVRRMAELACEMLERNGFTSRDLALVVPHQANLRIIRAMQERLGIDDSKVMINIERYGNTTAGTIPLGLRDAVEEGKLKKGDLVLLVAVGAGYTAGGVLLRWAY